MPWAGRQPGPLLPPFGWVTLLFRRAVHLPACQQACAEVSMQPVCEHACMLEVCGSPPDLLFGHYWVRSQQPWRPFSGSISFRALIFTNGGLKLASWIQMLLWTTNNKGLSFSSFSCDHKITAHCIPGYLFLLRICLLTRLYGVGKGTEGAYLHFFRPAPVSSLGSSALWRWPVGRMCNRLCSGQAEVLFPKAEGEVWIFLGVVLDFRLPQAQTPTHN